MRIHALLLAAPLLLLLACPTVEPEPEPELESVDLVGVLAEYLTGRFDSGQQSIDEPQYFAIQLMTCPVDAPELGEVVLYVEQAVMDDLGSPYRQRLYVLEADEEDDALVYTRVYALDAPTAAVGLCDDDDIPRFEADEVQLRGGCDVHLTWIADEERFEGGTVGTACASNLGDAVYATSEIALERDLLESWDRGWDASDAQAWGATAGPYRFLRQDD